MESELELESTGNDIKKTLNQTPTPFRGIGIELCFTKSQVPFY
jgi:hypothetical protein